MPLGLEIKTVLADLEDLGRYGAKPTKREEVCHEAVLLIQNLTVKLAEAIDDR